MSEASEVIIALVKSGPNLVRLTLSLGWMYMTLGWHVRNARHAFEKELRRIGMSKADAERLSSVFEELKNDLIGALKGGAFGGFTVRL